MKNEIVSSCTATADVSSLSVKFLLENFSNQLSISLLSLVGNDGARRSSTRHAPPAHKLDKAVGEVFGN